MPKQSGSASAIIFLLLAFVSTVGTFLAPSRPDWYSIALATSIPLVALAILFLKKMSEPKPVNWLTLDVIFANTFSLVHFAYFPYWLTGMLKDETPLWRINLAQVDHTVCTSLFMYAACLNMFLFGFHILGSNRTSSLFTEYGIPDHRKKQLGTYSRYLILLGVAGFAAYVAIVGPAVVFGSYSGTNNKGFLPNITFQLGQLYIVAGIAVAFACRTSNLQILGLRKGRRPAFGLGWMNLMMIGVVCFAIALHGDRSTLMWIIMAFVVGYSEYVKPISLKSVSLFSIGVVFFLGLIVLIRSVGTDDYNKSIVETINHTLLNFGASSVCGMVAVDHVEQDGLGYGQYQMLAIYGAVPLGRKLAGVTQSAENDSSTLMTDLINGRGSNVGAGTSVFADFYLDFGFWGCLLVFGMVGYWCKWTQNKARSSRDLLWQIGYLALCVFMTIVSRYSMLGGIIRLVIYASIFSWFVARFLRIATKVRLDPGSIPRTNARMGFGKPQGF